MPGINFDTISEMFISVTNKYTNKAAYGYKEEGVWKELTFGEVRSCVEKIYGGLKTLGIKSGDHVAIMSENSRWWAMSDYGILSAKGVTTTIYPTLTAKTVKWIIQHSESRFLFCGDKKQTEKILPMLDDLKNIVKVIVMDNTSFDHPNIITMKELMEFGETYRKENPGDFEKDAMSIKKDDPLTLIYTSGTTGVPKGVMLSHGNLTSNISSSSQVIIVTDQDVFLSFLPLSHTFERMAGHFFPFSVGAQVYYAESIEKVADNMQEVHPTLMIAVPRLYEKMYAKVIANVAASSSLKQSIFWWSIETGRKAIEKRHRGESNGVFLGLKLKIANKMVFSKLKEVVGGRMRFFVSGGAPLSKEIGEFFDAAGIIIIEGYGLTETSPVISANLLEKYTLGTVGPPLPGIEVKIADDGEILTRGPNVMKGYFKDEASTKEVFDEDGWFHTGDIGEFNEDGYLVITDRKKNILVTSGGKNVAPQPMENALITSKWIEQIVIIGDKRKFISALIVPAFPSLEEWAKEKGLEWEDRQELVELPDVKELYDKVIGESMEGFARFEKVKKFALLPDEFTIESGELTPSLKVRRNIVEDKYADIIDEIYKET
ncbi:MAG: long-chain fatty acid--CoA ligase [Candidatus Neomarinimicrobiota bacterium]|nr:MAG: long-chain fatty acid--CoA ligase [Candidatus Neomarinimicrobiota bacterium]